MSYWKNRVSNPNVLGPAEKALWKKIEPLLFDLLNELEANGKIETAYKSVQKQNLGPTMKKLDDFSEAHNTLLDIFRVYPDPKSFLKETYKFGFTENRLIYMYMACAVTMQVLSTELFKLRLLFIMKKVDSFAVSSFNKTINAAAPKSWPKLEPYVDRDFRNSLSHGTYAVVNKKITLFKDAKLFPPTDPKDAMSIGKFMLRVKNPNVLCSCLAYVLRTWKTKSGQLRP